MKRLLQHLRTKEWLAQGLFLVVLFFLYSFDKHSPHIEMHKFFFFLHYMSMAFFIGYVLLPLFFYTKKYLRFFSALLFVFAYAYVTEELVLYMFLGVFTIFVVDSFARAGKYTR